MKFFACRQWIRIHMCSFWERRVLGWALWYIQRNTNWKRINRFPKKYEEKWEWLLERPKCCWKRNSACLKSCAWKTWQVKRKINSGSYPTEITNAVLYLRIRYRESNRTFVILWPAKIWPVTGTQSWCKSSRFTAFLKKWMPSEKTTGR